MEETKVCSKCKITKLSNSFRHGRLSCIECQNRYMRDYRNNNKKRISDSKKKWYGNNRDNVRVNNRNKRLASPQNEMLKSAKQRAKKGGLDFDITFDDIIIPKICPVLGIPLYIGNKKSGDNSPTLDRIDNTKGYVKGNVCVISFRANSIKRDSTYVELLLVTEYVKNHV